MKQKLKRFFTVDQEHLSYYEGEKDRAVKKSLELKDALAFLEEKTEFMTKVKRGEFSDPDEWADPNQKYRVGIKLKGRDMRPVYFYSPSLHDAKFLLVNIHMYGN